MEIDPTEVLRLLRLTIRQMDVDESADIRKAHADEVAEYFQTLDAWLSRGGALPADWQRRTLD